MANVRERVAEAWKRVTESVPTRRRRMVENIVPGNAFECEVVRRATALLALRTSGEYFRLYETCKCIFSRRRQPNRTIGIFSGEQCAMFNNKTFNIADLDPDVQWLPKYGGCKYKIWKKQ